MDLIRKKKKTVCLSIGDGANDVSMIQKANIGCGIIGLEGTQAVRASDFAFKEFRFFFFFFFFFKKKIEKEEIKI